MNAFANLAYDNSIENEKDTLGGGYQPWESGVYALTIKLAYIETSKNGAMGLNCVFEDAAGKQYKETLWATNRKGENFYVNQEGQKKYLAGFIHADALCLLTAGKALSEVEAETIVVKLYNKEAGSEVPTKVQAIKEIMGQPVKLGIVKQRVNKTKLNEATGKYDPINEEKFENQIDKVFRAADDMTTAEIRAQVEVAEFMTEWQARWDGKLKDRYKEVKGGAARAGAPRAAAGATGAAPRSSLFA